ncbi:STAS domain-containing protein [Nonomuraea wenchangensis]|uniref:STAS domain-containing protein n=1 Tax=Nonomuraea wenchangensis TaxID=568860 RepID=UPI0034292EC1
MAAHQEVPDYGRGWAAVVLSERLDAATAAGIERELKLLPSDDPRLILEVSRLEDLDDHEYETLVSLADAVRERGGRMAVAGARGGTLRALTRPGLRGRLALFATVAEAVLDLDDGSAPGGSPA